MWGGGVCPVFRVYKRIPWQLLSEQLEQNASFHLAFPSWLIWLSLRTLSWSIDYFYWTFPCLDVWPPGTDRPSSDRAIGWLSSLPWAEEALWLSHNQLGTIFFVLGLLWIDIRLPRRGYTGFHSATRNRGKSQQQKTPRFKLIHKSPLPRSIGSYFFQIVWDCFLLQTFLAVVLNPQGSQTFRSFQGGDNQCPYKQRRP